MAKSIPVSPKHGLNPCIPVCFFCGEMKNEVALLGRLKGDAEAPHRAVLDYEPCDECKKNWSKGVVLLRVTEEAPKDGRPPITGGGREPLYPTGQYLVVRPRLVKDLFGLDADNGSVLFMEDVSYDRLLSDAAAQGVYPDRKI